MTREIVLDTETTGIDPKDGHRIIEIGALEMDNHMPTGKQLHLYINPERDIDAGAGAIHGLTTEFLADKPVFADIVDEFLNFVGDSPMVIHNAPFDMGFVNAELARLARAPLPMTQAVDTLPMARKKFPGAQANLNALCRRFEIDNSHRDLHGALIDADLLAAVYVELLGGRQPGLSLEAASAQNDLAQNNPAQNNPAQNNPARHAQGAGRPADSDMDNDAFSLRADSTRFERPHEPTPDERAAHATLVARIPDAIWSRS
jgi:DNA polymerase-3 subunit epsilon